MWISLLPRDDDPSISMGSTSARRLRANFAACLAACIGLLSCARLAAAQVPRVQRDSTWGTTSDVAAVIAGVSVFLMPRVATASIPGQPVDWYARWHVSHLAPTMTMAAISVIVAEPVKDYLGSPRSGCTHDQTIASVRDSGCETFGGPSVHAFTAMGSLGLGIGIFAVDMIRYSDRRFHVPSFLGNVFLPAAGATLVLLGRTIPVEGTRPYEAAGQVVAGAIPGLFTGLTVGFTYAMLQPPGCERGAVLCW